MFKATIVGYLGADAEFKGEQGKEFVTCRVAHTDRWTDGKGQVHEQTQWIDLTLNGRPKVADYLKKGTLIYASGDARLRCYSSEKARGFVAGATIRVTTIELLGGNSDAIPSKLYDAGGAMVNVQKYYWCDRKGEVLTNGRGIQYATDDNGWIVQMQDAPQDVQQAVQSENNEQEKEPTKKKK